MVSLVKSYAGLFSLFSSIRLWELVPKSPSSIDLSVHVPLANESWRLNPGFLLPISQASREVTGSARPGNRGRQRRLLTQGLRLLWTVTWRGGWDPFLWGSCSPLAHTPDLVVAFAPKPSEHQCWAACLFLVILLNRDNLPACTVLEISSAQDTRIFWRQFQQNPYSPLKQFLICVGGLTEVLNSGWWWELGFGLTIYSFFYLWLRAHTVSWSLMGDKTRFWLQVQPRVICCKTQNHLWIPFFTSTSPSGLHYVFVWWINLHLQILTWKKRRPWRQPLRGGPLHTPLGLKHHILTSHLLKLTGPETLAMRCFWRLWRVLLPQFSCCSQKQLHVSDDEEHCHEKLA